MSDIKIKNKDLTLSCQKRHLNKGRIEAKSNANDK